MPNGTRLCAYVVVWLAFLGLIAWRHSTRPHFDVLATDSPPGRFAIDVNHDSWQRLTLIEGIGERLAKRIVAERERRDGFTSLEEVKAVTGVPDRAIEDFADHLALGDGSTKSTVRRPPTNERVHADE